MKKISTFGLGCLLLALLLSACGGGGGAVPGASTSTSKAITAFGFTTPAATGTIDETAKTIALTVPYGTNASSLVATFITTGASVKIGSTEQASGTTANDFTSPVSYLVSAADGSAATYTVTVTVASSAAKAITAFGFTAPAATGTIDETAKTIALTVPYGTNTSSLVATFTSTGASVKVGATAQTSGTTANDFTGSVVYTVTAADASTAAYTVTVTVASLVQMGGARQGGAALNLTGLVSSLTGTANTAMTAGAADGTGTAATFNLPFGVTTDGTNLYVADTSNNTIRKIVIATGAVTTLAGSSGAIGALDGTGTAATFNWPTGVTTDGTSLYVADTGSRKIRKIVIATGVVTTLAGSGANGTADGTGVAATFDYPAGVTTDGTSLYVADYNRQKIRKIVIATGVVTTLAGSGAIGAADGTGMAATFDSPYGITTDGTSLYVTDSGNHKIRKIVIATGVVTTLAGSGVAGAVDGTGTAATFSQPYGVTTDGTSLYVADTSNNKIRKIVLATGVVTTLAGSGSASAVDGTGTGATFNNSYSITTDGTSLYVVDSNNNKIRKIQ